MARRAAATRPGPQVASSVRIGLPCKAPSRIWAIMSASASGRWAAMSPLMWPCQKQ